MTTSNSPANRLGVFKRLNDVPTRRRLFQYESVYAGQDTWAEYRATVELSERMDYEWGLFSRRWKEHIEERGRHHALAQPQDVETWSATLVDQFKIDRAYQHWNVIEGFYDWLRWHTDHQHTYNPFHMAAVESESAAREVWEYKMERRQQ